MVDIVFVVGAGASYELGLPLGSGLLEQVANTLSIGLDDRGRLTGGSDNIRSFLISKRRQINIESYIHATEIIRRAYPLALSIDNLIDSHRTNKSLEEIAKIAIVECILSAERSSKIFQQDKFKNSPYGISPNFGKSKNSWIRTFFQMLNEN